MPTDQVTTEFGTITLTNGQTRVAFRNVDDAGPVRYWLQGSNVTRTANAAQAATFTSVPDFNVSAR